MEYKICKIRQGRGRKREWHEIKKNIGTEMEQFEGPVSLVESVQLPLNGKGIEQ
jgi:hypothetical protein